MQNPKILVIGSFMMDLVVRTPRAPKDGETVIGTDYKRFPGGKGANQAVAAARLGAQVTMAGKLGSDSFGDEMLAALEADHVDTANILRDPDAPTGVGAITLDDQGNNRIVVIPGANFMYTAADVASIESLIQGSDIVMLQLEMDMTVIRAAITLAKKHNTPVILNPAPAQELDDELLAKVTYLTPNESEAELLTGIKVTDQATAAQAARKLLARGVGHIAITLAEQGALVADPTGIEHIPSYRVQPVDSVAAGDAFNGALAVGIAQGQQLAEAARFANAVGAITVTREGAIPSLPCRADVEHFLREKRNIS